jgi:uncharacterized protein YaiI (UPF0178 family)
MKILVDADSCPRPARELVLRRARKAAGNSKNSFTALFAANRPMPGVPEDQMLVCPARDQAADDRIAEIAGPGDIAITRDIPLAERLVGAGVTVIDDRGRRYSAENIRESRSLRDFVVGLAADGVAVGQAGAAYGKKELKAFADALDREITKLLR